MLPDAHAADDATLPLRHTTLDTPLFAAAATRLMPMFRWLAYADVAAIDYAIEVPSQCLITLAMPAAARRAFCCCCALPRSARHVARPARYAQRAQRVRACMRTQTARRCAFATRMSRCLALCHAAPSLCCLVADIWLATDIQESVE